jgi:hypothetical protein
VRGEIAASLSVNRTPNSGWAPEIDGHAPSRAARGAALFFLVRTHPEDEDTMSRTKLNTAIATTALVVAVLGATPVGNAAGKLFLPSKSVGTAQLQSNAVNSAKVRNRSLLAVDFKNGQLPAGPPKRSGRLGPAGSGRGAGSEGRQG